MVCYVRRKTFTQKLAKDKHYGKVRDHCHFVDKYRDAVHIICNVRSNVTNNFHNVSNCTYLFIIK